MLLRVNRFKYGSKATIGRLLIDGVVECYTLEDVKRPDGVKVQDATAIPAGEYKVIIDKSERFGRLMPHILGVDGFTGIRIHSGNTDENTDGCILLGSAIENDDFVSGSKTAFDKFFKKLTDAIAAGQSVVIVVHNG